MDHRPKHKSCNCKTLRSKYKGTASCHWIWSLFLDMTPNAQATKEQKPDKLDFMKIKTFCASKDAINRMKREPTEQKKILTNVSNKGLIEYVKISYNSTAKTKTTKNRQRT